MGAICVCECRLRAASEVTGKDARIIPATQVLHIKSEADDGQLNTPALDGAEVRMDGQATAKCNSHFPQCKCS